MSAAESSKSKTWAFSADAVSMGRLGDDRDAALDTPAQEDLGFARGGLRCPRPQILPRYSYLLAGLIPRARLKIYPDAAHGFLFQHHAEFAAVVEAFLAGA